MENRQPDSIFSLKETVESLRVTFLKSDRFIRYYRADVDSQFNLLMMITEYSPDETLRQYVEQYGFLDEIIAGNISYFIQ